MMASLKKRERTLLALGIAGIVMAALASTIYFTRIDLSSSRAYTLSRAARQIGRELSETVRITYFVSKNLADRHPGPGAIEDLLREIEASNKGKVRVRVVDPTKDASEAESFGLVAQQMQVVERSEQRIALVYTGIVIEYLDQHETIPAILSTETLEYELIKAIRTVAGGKRPVAGLLVGDSDKSLQNDYQTLYGILAQAGYIPREQVAGQAVEDDVDILFVLGNSSLDRYDASFVNAFMMRGGKAFFAVKGVDIDPENGLAAKALPEGGFLSMLASYGFKVPRQLVLDQSNLTVPFQTQTQTGAYQIQYIRYPHWVAVDVRYTSADSPLTARFSGLDLFWSSPLELSEIAGVTYQELAKTTTKAWLQTANFAAGPQDQPLYTLEREETLGQYLLAASANGSFPSAFASGDQPSREGAAPAPVPAATQSPETRVVVVSSADFLTDLMKLSDSGFNASFAVSAADWLSSSDDLIAIRTRAETDTRLNKIQDEDLRDFLIALTYIITLGLVPLGVIAYGLLRSARRNKLERASRIPRGVEA
jgi:ABC-type uncharacterized transport system involved in gliding motility auxiliary subunit